MQRSSGLAPAGTPCGGGDSRVCAVSGECVECLDGSLHCPRDAQQCLTMTHTCVECTLPSHCQAGQSCQLNKCVNACGNGLVDPGEECDPNATSLGWGPGNCITVTCEETVYTREQRHYCMEFDGPANGPQDCPPLPGSVVSCALQAGASCEVVCSTNADCPAGLDQCVTTNWPWEGAPQRVCM